MFIISFDSVEIKKNIVTAEFKRLGGLLLCGNI
jgi:hypothetical protein